MMLSNLLRLSCLGISLAGLAGGFASQMRWLEASLVLLVVVALAFAPKTAADWLALACLVALVFLAAVGLLVGAPASLMIPGAAAALAAWDLTNMGRLVEGRTLSATEQRMEKRHLLSLALAVGLGLLLAGSGQLISLEIPFALLLVLAGLALFSLDRAYRYLAERVRH